MRTIALFTALAFAACGPLVSGPVEPVRCAHVDGGFSTVVCSCASSCALQPDLLVHVEIVEGCGEAACWREPSPGVGLPDAGPLLLQ